MVFPPASGHISEQKVEYHLIKLTNRLIKDINNQFAYIFENKDVQNERQTLLILYNELRNELHSIIFNIKGALERLSEQNFTGNTLKTILKDIECIGYLAIHPSLTFNTGTLRNLINKTSGIIHKNFVFLVDLTEMEELKGDNRTRREYITILNDILLMLERTRLHCPRVNIYDEQITISMARTESIKQIKFSEEYQKTFFFESIRIVIQSMKDIIHHFHRSLYGYKHSMREFLMGVALKLHTELVDFEAHLVNFIKSKDNEVYEGIAGELCKFFEIWNKTIQWIVDSSEDSNLKYEVDTVEMEEIVTPECETDTRSLAAMLEDNMKITEALVLAKSRDAEEIPQENELLEELKRKCKIADVDFEFEDYGSFSCRELQRRFTSDYIILSRRFIREINVLFGIVNKICLRKIRYNKKKCDCEICKGEL